MGGYLGPEHNKPANTQTLEGQKLVYAEPRRLAHRFKLAKAPAEAPRSFAAISSAENLINLRGQLKIQIAYALHAMRIQIDHYFIPNIAPFRMVVHGLSDKRHARHIAKRGHEILALKRAMQFAVG
jgi:hypothetical protein